MKHILAGSVLALAASGIVAGSTVFNHPNQFFPFTINHPAVLASGPGDVTWGGPAHPDPSSPTAVEHATSNGLNRFAGPALPSNPVSGTGG
jgi:hypothetical protein